MQGEEKETGGSPSIGGSSLRMEGTAEEAMIDHLGSPTCQPSVSPTTVDTPSSVTSSMEDAITPAINGGIISSSSLSSPAPVPPPVPEPDVPPKEAELLWTKPSHLIVNRSSSSSGTSEREGRGGRGKALTPLCRLCGRIRWKVIECSLGGLPRERTASSRWS